MMDPLIHGKWIFRLLNWNSSDQLRSLLNHLIHPWSPNFAAGGIMTASCRWLTNIQFWPHSATWKPWCFTKQSWQNNSVTQSTQTILVKNQWTWVRLHFFLWLCQVFDVSNVSEVSIPAVDWCLVDVFHPSLSDWCSRRCDWHHLSRRWNKCLLNMFFFIVAACDCLNLCVCQEQRCSVSLVVFCSSSFRLSFSKCWRLASQKCSKHIESHRSRSRPYASIYAYCGYIVMSWDRFLKAILLRVMCKGWGDDFLFCYNLCVGRLHARHIVWKQNR